MKEFKPSIKARGALDNNLAKQFWLNLFSGMDYDRAVEIIDSCLPMRTTPIRQSLKKLIVSMSWLACSMDRSLIGTMFWDRYVMGMHMTDMEDKYHMSYNIRGARRQMSEYVTQALSAMYDHKSFVIEGVDEFINFHLSQTRQTCNKSLRGDTMLNRVNVCVSDVGVTKREYEKSVMRYISEQAKLDRIFFIGYPSSLLSVLSGEAYEKSSG